jgi:hypothetical protein
MIQNMNNLLSVFLLLAAMTAAEARLGHKERDLQQFNLCQGDCSSDSDCVLGMMCFHRLSGDPLPFCSIKAGDTEAKTAVCVPVAVPENLLGPSYEVQSRSIPPPLGVCEGDCNVADAHCQEGLICFERNSGQPVPGCHDFDGGKSAFCIDPSAQVTPTFPFTGSNSLVLHLNYGIDHDYDRQPTSEEYAELTAQTDKWFTDETDRIFASSTRQLQEVGLSIMNSQFLPNQQLSQQVAYSVTIIWSAENAESVPSDIDIVWAFRAFDYDGHLWSPTQFNTLEYVNLYLDQLPSSNPFGNVETVSEGIHFPD